MTARKENLRLPPRTPAYVDRETGASGTRHLAADLGPVGKGGAPPLPVTRLSAVGPAMALG